MNSNELSQLLEMSYCQEPERQKQASQALVDLRKKPGYISALREVMGSGCHDHIKLAASIQFKMVIREHWVADNVNEASPLSNEERNMIKQSLLDMTLTSNARMKKQLQESITEIGKHDFPLAWENLLPCLVERSQSLEHIVDVLKVVHSVTKRYRNQFKSSQTLIELKAILEAFQAPFLDIAKKVHQFISEVRSDVDKLVYGFKAMVLISRIFYSLNYVDLPEFFEDHISDWMTIFLSYVEYETTEERILEHDDPDKAGLLHRLQAEICTCLALYADKYDSEFAPFLEGFAQATWKLLTKVNQERRFDSVASEAISFLSISSSGVNHKLFDNKSAMTGVCQQIIVPNMFFTKSDEEDFQDNPVEYIRRDIEGSDSGTRRRSSFLFVKRLRKYFEAEVTNILAADITERLKLFASNPAENWREKDVCTYLVSALAVTNQTSADGATSTNSLVPILDYFQTHILPDLQSFPAGNPVLQADALKFATTFRLVVPLDLYPPLLECFAKMIASESYVVNTYAAVAIEKYLTARNPDKSFRIGDKYKECVPSILKNSFEVLKRKQKAGQDHNCNENEYTMKCIMRILSKLQQDVAPFYQLVIQELSVVLAEVSKNPQNPTFSHYLFESIAAVIKNVASGDPSKVPAFQELLLPSFQHVLAQDVAEYSPYVFQVMALMLEMSNDVPPAYTAIFPQLLNPSLWERTANIPGVVRLLQAYIQKLKGSPDVLKYLEGILGIFQRLVGSKQHDHEGFYLLEAIVQYLPLEAFQQYLPTVWNLIFIRLTKSKTGKFMRVFTIFMSLFCALHPPDFVINSVDSVTKDNPDLFAMVLGNVWLENVHAVGGHLERKICSVGMTRLLTQSPQLVGKYFKFWVQTLTATLKVIVGGKEEAKEDDIIEEEAGYKASFSKLAHGRKQDVDPFPQLDKAIFFAESVHNFSKQHPGKLSPVVEQNMEGPAREALNNLFAQANTPRPFLA